MIIKKAAFIITVLMLAVSVSIVHAQRHRKPVTPYGDYCPRCTKYGICEKTMSHDDAKRAMMDYYHEKGFVVEVEKKRGRFIRAKVKKGEKVMDVIIFDRRTGRVRSIY